MFKFLYKDKETEVFIDDVDLVNLLDMIIDYWDTAEREEHLMPEHPNFSYVYKKRHVQLGDDKALLEMEVDPILTPLQIVSPRVGNHQSGSLGPNYLFLESRANMMRLKWIPHHPLVTSMI